MDALSVHGVGPKIALTPYLSSFHPSVFLSSHQTVVLFQSLPFFPFLIILHLSHTSQFSVNTLCSYPLLRSSASLFSSLCPLSLTSPSSLLFTPLSSWSPASLPARRMCAALHGQWVPQPVSSQSLRNTRKLPNADSRRRGDYGQ